MNIIRTQTLTPQQKDAIYTLWNVEFPVQLGHKTMDALDGFLNNISNKEYYFLRNERDEIAGWIILFDRENERWFSLVIDGRFQKKGFGTLLLNEAKKNEPMLVGWVIDHTEDKKQNGESYPSPLPFYTRNGFVVVPEVRLDLEIIRAAKIKWTNADSGLIKG